MSKKGRRMFEAIAIVLLVVALFPKELAVRKLENGYALTLTPWWVSLLTTKIVVKE